MREERTRKITCDACGYSEVVPGRRLVYEEGKTCPRCYRGKMYWVPLAEEARRREVKMPGGERRISPLWIIPVGLAVGAAVGLGILARAAPPTAPPGRATLYGKVTDAVTGEPIADVLVILNGMLAYTNGGGDYAFPDLEPGGYRLELSKEGYESLASDIALVEGNNELNVEMAPIGIAEFVYVSGIRQIQYESAPGKAWSRPMLRAEIDVQNTGSIAGVCTCKFQIACAEGDWAWKSYPEVSQLTIQPGGIGTFVGDVLDSPSYGYTCKCRFTGDPGTTAEVTMI